MHLRTLGNTGLKVPILGIGSSPFRHGTPKTCALLLEQAVELGVTYYDTARSYVNGEEALANVPPHVKEQMVIATKTGARGGKYCLEDLQRSLRTMKHDRIDVWMAHMIQTDVDYEQCTALGGFCDIAIAARQAGLVRATGASFHAPTRLILRAIEERAFDVVMFQFNLIGRETVFGSSIASYREKLLPVARSNGTGVVVMKVLAGGELRHGASRLQFVANPVRGRGVTEGALRYVAMNPDIATAVVGMSGTDELVRNVMAVEDLDDTHFPRFLEWTNEVADVDHGECTRCGECLTVCPQKIEIPKIFRLHDQLRFFGIAGVTRYKYAMVDPKASACSMCGKCEEVCPQMFDIEKALSVAHEALTFQASNTLNRIAV